MTTDWQPISTAPKDGTLVQLRRVTPDNWEIVGEGLFGMLHEDAPGMSVMGLDPLGRLSEAVYAREAQQAKEWAAVAKWLRPDRMYAFPPPTHWMPLSTTRLDIDYRQI